MPDSGLYLRDHNWLKIKTLKAFIDLEVVEWFLNHMEVVIRESMYILKFGFIHHALTKIANWFNNQIFYTSFLKLCIN